MGCFLTYLLAHGTPPASINTPPIGPPNAPNAVTANYIKKNYNFMNNNFKNKHTTASFISQEAYFNCIEM
jgi:hypothetical protein